MSWQTAMLPAYAPGGRPIISVLAKRTYVIAPGKTTPADEQLPIYNADIPAEPDNPFSSELIAETDLVGFKPFTDVVVLAQAHTPRGKRAYHIECEARIGPIRKIVRVYGDRRLESKALRGLSFSDPEPFESRSITYRNAYGGTAKSKEGTLFTYPPNPLGKGFYLKGGFEDISEIPVPNQEDPESPIQPESLVLGRYEEWRKGPKPASFGWTRQIFYPRWTYASVLPEMLAGAFADGKPPDTRAPKLDFRFFQGASEGMGDRVLAGNEHVVLTHMDPACPQFEFDLPGEAPAISLTLGPTTHALQPVLQTVLIDKENGLLTMVFRGSREYGGIEELGTMRIDYAVSPA